MTSDKAFIFFQKMLPQLLLTKIAGYLANCEIKWLKNYLISIFIKKYQVDLSICKIQNIQEFKNFNDFFTRELAKSVRNIDSNPQNICSPADGFIYNIGKIENQNNQAKLIQAKNSYYTLERLIVNKTFYKGNYIQAQYTTIYLSPKDYHKVHMPFGGKLTQAVYIPGKFFSVNAVTTQYIDNVFADNERLVMEFYNEENDFYFLVIMVGAMIVAGISTIFSGAMNANHYSMPTQLDCKDVELKKGDELGAFYLGSTVILLTQKPVDWLQNDNTSIQMGQKLAKLKI